MNLSDFRNQIGKMSISTGVVCNRDLGFLLMTNDELTERRIPHTSIFQIFRGQMGGFDLQWTACSATSCPSSEEHLLAVAQQSGAVFSFGKGGSSVEMPIDKSELFKKRGYLREVKYIAKGRAYAVGTCRQAYRRDGPGKWVCIDIWNQPNEVNITDYCFESIDGFSENDIYVVGWEGEIWHYDGKVWSSIQSPTNLALYKVLCASDGTTYIAGQAGTLLRGRGTEWEVIEHDITDEDFWGIEWFNSKLYVSTTNFVYELEGLDLRRVDFGDADIPKTCYHLSAADGIMWLIGAKDVMQFDGHAWTRII